MLNRLIKLLVCPALAKVAPNHYYQRMRSQLPAEAKSLVDSGGVFYHKDPSREGQKIGIRKAFFDNKLKEDVDVEKPSE